MQTSKSNVACKWRWPKPIPSWLRHNRQVCRRNGKISFGKRERPTSVTTWAWTMNDQSKNRLVRCWCLQSTTLRKAKRPPPTKDPYINIVDILFFRRLGSFSNNWIQGHRVVIVNYCQYILHLPLTWEVFMSLLRCRCSPENTKW